MSAIDCEPNPSASIAPASLLLGRGLPCFPCGIAKEPATPRGFKDATCDPEALRELWKRYPGPLVGVPTGEISGFDVLDIDARHGGQLWFFEHRPRLMPTRAHRTRSGGIHLLFQHAPGLRCSAGKIAAGVDVRADGGYVIWWPAAGLPILSDVFIARWPNWLSDHLLPVAKLNARRAIVPDRYVLDRLVRLVAGATKGERNAITFWAACRAGEMVASGLLTADLAVTVIAEAATRSGLSATEAERTAWSGIRTAARGSYV